MKTVIECAEAQQVLDAAPIPNSPLATMARTAGALAVLNPGALLQIAVERGDSIEVLTKLMDLKDRYDAKMAVEAFNAAFAAFKAEAVVLIRNKLIADGPLKGKKHAELSDAVNAATPALSKHGLSVSWSLKQDRATGQIEVTCTLRHAAGHSESVTMVGDPDTGPGRNKIQAIGSTKTYLERYTYTAILGLAAQDADDDGAGGAPTAGPEAALMQRLIAEAQQTTTDADALAHWKINNKALINWPYAFDRYKKAVADHRSAMKQGATA